MALPGVDIGAVEEQVQRQCDALPRADAARSALSHSCIVCVSSREEARARGAALPQLDGRKPNHNFKRNPQ